MSIKILGYLYSVSVPRPVYFNHWFFRIYISLTEMTQSSCQICSNKCVFTSTSLASLKCNIVVRCTNNRLPMYCTLHDDNSWTRKLHHCSFFFLELLLLEQNTEEEQTKYNGVCWSCMTTANIMSVRSNIKQCLKSLFYFM